MSDREITSDIKTEVEIGENVHEVEFTRTTKIVHDSDYGADADGNRGVPMDFIDDDYYDDVFVDGKPLKEYSNDFQAEIHVALEEYLDTHEAE